MPSRALQWTRHRALVALPTSRRAAGAPAFLSSFSLGTAARAKSLDSEWVKSHLGIMTSFQKFARGYRTFAVYFLNTALMSAVVAGVYFLVRPLLQSKQRDDPITRYGVAQLLPGYPGRSANEIAVLLKETYDRPLIYEPFTHFRELPATGRFVNVAPGGFRLIEDQGPWPLDSRNFNVFVFGGSTTFGYSVADAETIPSALQQELRASLKRACVYNFGRCFYYSSQERILFSNLLAAGIVPDVAVFIDGLNDFYRAQDAPQYSSQFMAMINQSLRERKGLETATVMELVSFHPRPEPGTEEEKARRMCERYLRNKSITRLFGRRASPCCRPEDPAKKPSGVTGFARRDFLRRA